jgi:vacuolar protein sorting-associated protein 13A/C
MTSSTASLSSAAPKIYKLKSRQTVAYSWDFPHLKEKVLVLNVNGSEREVKLQEIGSLMPFEFRTANNALGVMSMDVIAEGPTQVLVLSDYDSKRSLYKRSHGLMSVEERGRDNDRSSTKDSSKDGFEVIDVDAVVSFSFQVQLECIGISVLNQRMQELVYLSMTGFELRYKDSNLNQSLNLQVKWLQIDNQLYGGFSPIVLCPTQIPKGEKDALTHPTLHMALVKAKDDTHGVVYFKYFSILIQELTVAMDEDFLFTLLEFTKFNVPGWTEDTSKVQWCEESLALPQITTGDDENQLFFEVLQLQPMKVNLSFKRSDRVNIEQAQQKTSSSNPIMYIFNVLTMAIGNVDVSLPEGPKRMTFHLYDRVANRVPFSFPNVLRVHQSH